MENGVLSFGSLYSLFIDILGYVSKAWSFLNTPVANVELFDFSSIEANGLIGALIGSTLNSLTSLVSSVLGGLFGSDLTLLELGLGGAVVAIVGAMVVKFVLSFIPVL